MFLPNKTIKNKKFNYGPKTLQSTKTTQYEVDNVMFLPSKIIKNKKKVIIEPCARPSKQLIV